MMDIIHKFNSKIEKVKSDKICLRCKNKTASIAVVENAEYFICSECSIRISMHDLLMKTLLNAYKQLKWSIVPEKNKSALEEEWTTINHYDISEWSKWLKEGYYVKHKKYWAKNIGLGVRTGSASNITVIDVDELDKFPEKWLDSTIVQKTPSGGYHLFFQYEPDMRTTQATKGKLGIEVCGDGKKVTIYPSNNYLWKNFTLKMPKMPKELKELILANCKKSENLSDDIYKEIDIPEGQRNNQLVTIGGVLRKFLPKQQLNNTLRVINQSLCNPSLPQMEITNLVKMLSSYDDDDNDFFKNQVYEYLKMVDEEHSRDISQALEIKRGRTDGFLKKLCDEGKIMKIARATYKVKVRADWKEGFEGENIQALDYKVPYFDDIAYFVQGDMIIIGGQPKIGKTTIAVNVLKKLVVQKTKPHYLCIEGGARLKKTTNILKIDPKSFLHLYECDPMKIEIESNAITILDWLYIEDKSMTDKIFKYLSEKLQERKGLLIVFVQLKENGDWFAPNMIKQFPSLAAKYFYSDETGETGYFEVSTIRDPKGFNRFVRIPCRYDRYTKVLEIINEENQ